MRKILFNLLLLLPMLSFGQQDYDTYTISVNNVSENQKIEISENKGQLDEIYIYTRTLDKSYEKGVLIIKAKDLPTFVEYLKYVKVKYVDWSEAAKKNDVKEVKKKIEADLRDKYMAAFGYSDWYFDRSVKMSSLFVVDDYVASVYIVSDKLYSMTNQYISCDGLIIPFSNLDDVEDLIGKLDLSKMQKVLNESKAVKEIFN